MRIKELSLATGVDVETIRFYEKEQLLPAAARSENGYRNYGSAHLERLAFVRHCRALDMPLSGIKRLLQFVDDPTGNCMDVDLLVDEQLQRVRARLQSMRALQRQLVQLRSRCKGTHEDGECGILQELVAAAHGEACVCHGSLQPRGT